MNQTFNYFSGSMNTGKSTWIYHFIKHLQDVCHTSDINDKFDLFFCYSSPSSLREFQLLSNESSLIQNFESILGLPSEKLIRSLSCNNEIHKILIFEDLSYSIQSMNQEYTKKLCNLVLNSRHYNISILHVLHQVPLNIKTKGFSFDKVILQNCTLLVLFDGLMANHDTRILVNRIMPGRYTDFIEMMEFSSKLCRKDKEEFGSNSRPYLVVNLDNRQNIFSDFLNRVSCDIYNRWVTFSPGKT